MPRNRIIPYNPTLKRLAKTLRKNSTLGEILLWLEIKNKSLGYQFHRQVPLYNYIADFYCHELQLVIEIDGASHDNKYEQDEIRTKSLESFGVRVIRFDEIEVRKSMSNVLRVISNEISELEKNK